MTKLRQEKADKMQKAYADKQAVISEQEMNKSSD